MSLKEQIWEIQDQDISLLTCIENLSIRLKITFMQLVQNIRMNLAKSAKFMIYQKINGQKLEN
jgi:hypothetical protein